MDAVHQKLENLCAYFKELGSVAIAFSSGVDSTFMLKVASDVLPKDNILAITAVSAFLPQREKTEAEEFCLKHSIKHIFLPIDALSIDGVAQNPKNRCYLCKYALFSKIKAVASENGIACVCEGSNLDDLSDYRPGMVAIEELEVKSPLKMVGLTKQDIRDLSKEMDLPTWNKPSFACLASRFVYGEQITNDKLQMVEKAEKMLLDWGFKQVRVRIHGLMARIEVLPQDFAKVIALGDKIYSGLHNLGFSYVTLDLKGFRSGSMNEGIGEGN